MSGWRKKDSNSNSRADSSRPVTGKSNGDASNRSNASSAPTNSEPASASGGGWRKSDSPTKANSASPAKSGWRGGRTPETRRGPSSKRRWLLIGVGLLFIFFAVWFVDILFRREQLIDVVLYQRGIDSSEIDNTPLGLMPLSQQWAKANRNNCRVTPFHQYKDAERKSPLLLVVQSEVDASQVKQDVKAILDECLKKIRDNSTVIVVLDLFSTPNSIPMLNYADPARGIGQYTDYYQDVVNVWEEVLQTAEVKSSRKKLIVLVANSSKNAQAWSAPELNGSVLQNFVIDALSDPECDANNDYNVTLKELETFVGQRVADWVNARRAAIQTPKLLLADENQRTDVLYKRFADNWVNRFIGRRRKLQTPVNVAIEGSGIASVQQNWNKIDALWGEYEILLDKKVYRWAPERMMRIAHGLTTLEHFAERVDILKQASASRLFRTVELELKACPKTPPNRIDFESLGMDLAASGSSRQELMEWATWNGKLPKYLSGPDRSTAADENATNTSSSKSADEQPDVSATATNSTDKTANADKDAIASRVSSDSTDDKAQFSAVDRGLLVWQSIRNFPETNDPNDLKQFLELGLRNVELTSPSPALQFLMLLRHDSYWFKTTDVLDTPTKLRFGQTLGRSMELLGQWMELVFVERRPDAVLKLSNSLDQVSVEVQNLVVDSWLAGQLPSDDVLGNLRTSLANVQEGLKTWEDAYDARDEFFLYRPYLICWLAAASEFADSSDQNALSQLSEKIKDYDDLLGNFSKTADQKFANQLVERWASLRDDYKRLGLSKLPADGSMPSEESFVWLRITRSLPVALDEEGRRQLREKMVEYISGKADIDVGKGDGEGKSEAKARQVSNEKRSSFISDLSGKFPLDTMVRLGEIPQDDTTSQSRWLRSPLALFYQASYQQPSQAISARDKGDELWSDLVQKHSRWLQQLVVTRMTWGNGSVSVEAQPYFQRLARACGVVDGNTAPGMDAADESTSNAMYLRQILSETTEAVSKFRFDVNGNTKFTYNAAEIPPDGLRYPIQLQSGKLTSWGAVSELSCWIEGGNTSQIAAAFRGKTDGSEPYSFSMAKFIESGIQGKIAGSFRGNQFGQTLIITPESRKFVETNLLRNTSPGRLTVQGINAPKLNVVFAIDISGSMNQAPPNAEKTLGSRLGQAKAIMNESIALIKKEYLDTGIVGEVKIGLVLFSGDVLEQELVDIRDFRPGFPPKGKGETRLVDGYLKAIEMVANLSDEECLVIGITDGMDTSDGGGTQAKDVNVFLREKISRADHIQCLLLQAASKQTFVKEMVDSITDTEKFSVEGTRSHWSSQWDKAQESLAQLQQNSNGRFIWYKEEEINSRNMMEQINSILPGTQVVVDGTLKIADKSMPLSQYATLPNAMLQPPANLLQNKELLQWSNGIGGWRVSVQQRNRRLKGDESGRRGITASYGPFPIWGGENVQLIFDQRNGSLFRKDDDERPEISQQMRNGQWIAPRLLEGRDGVSVSIDFGCEPSKPVDRPELIFVEQIQNGEKMPLVSDFVYKLSFNAQHSASFLETPGEWFERKTPTEKVRMDHRIWTVQRCSAVGNYCLPTIEPISQVDNPTGPLDLGNMWSNQKAPEVTVRRFPMPNSKGEQVEIYLSGENATEWFVALVGNVWKDVHVKTATDRTWVRKVYTVSDGYFGQPIQAVLISADQLRTLSEESSARNDGAVEMFEFESLLESSR